MYKLNGKPVVSDRYSKGEVMPLIDAKQNINIISTDNGVYKFTRPLNTGDSFDKPITDSVQGMIWAWGNAQVTSETNIPQHDQRGSFKLNLLSANSTVSFGTSLDYKKVVLTHGLMMAIGWAILVVAGIFVARFLKNIMGVWWYRAHVGLMMFNVVLSIIAFGLIVAVTEDGKHFKNSHQIIGLVVFIAVILQSILGQYINLMWNPTRVGVPWHDQLHWWLGRILAVLALVNIFLGLNLYGVNSEILRALFGVWIAIIATAFAIGHWRLGGQVKHSVHDSDMNLNSKDSERPEMEISSPQPTMI